MKKKIKVLFFVDRLLHGGIQSMLLNWITNFDNKIDADILVLDDGNTYELESVFDSLGCKVFKLYNIWINDPFDYYRQAKALDDFFSKHNDYDVLHLNGTSKNFLILKYAKKYGIPIRIIHSHSSDYASKNHFKKIVGNLLKYSVFYYATDYVACSNTAALWMFGKKMIRDGKVKIIRNGINYDNYKFNENIRSKIRKKYCIDEDCILLGHVGRFSYIKNHSFLIDVFYEYHNIVKNSKLILIGVGETEQEIHAKVKKMNLSDSVIFAGFRKDVNEFLQAMDLFILPSFYEGLPLVGVEAQAAGLSVFSSDTVSKELAITPKVVFMPLKDGAKKWASSIISSDISRFDSYDYLKSNGYINSFSIDNLLRIYKGE